ncbi:MAG: cysteine hydrolase family protein [Sedimentitalea sp.]
MDVARTALLIVDLQNDFLHPEGAYGRAAQTADAIAQLPPRVGPVADAMRAAGGLVISTQFTLVPGRGGVPMIAPHLAKLRPFLTQGDFAPGSWGNQMVDSLGTPDFVIEKIAYSAFYMTRLEWVLRKAGVDHLVVAGIVTNGGVASTVRGAHVLDFHTTVLSDGCAAFGAAAHDAAIADLSTVSDVMSCAQALDLLGRSD